MIDVIIEQRINPGMEAEFEALARQAEQSTLANDDGCLRYEWYRADENVDLHLDRALAGPRLCAGAHEG